MGIRKAVRQSSKFLDPDSSVGSSIRYRFNIALPRKVKDKKKQSTYIDMDLDMWMTDCTRSINWSGYGSGGLTQMRTKIRNAKRILSKAERDLDYIRGIYKAYKKANPTPRKRELNKVNIKDL